MDNFFDEFDLPVPNTNHDDTTMNPVGDIPPLQTHNSTSSFLSPPSNGVGIRSTFERLALIIPLDQENYNAALQICETTGPNEEFPTTIFFLTHVLEGVMKAVMIQQAAQTWVPSEQLREIAKNQFGNIILSAEIDAYSLIKDASKRIIPRSLTRRAEDFVAAQDEAWVTAFLPAGYREEDAGKAHRQVNGFVKDILKNLRSNLRGLLLNNVLPENGIAPVLAIPTIKQLIVLLARTYTHKDTLLTDTQLYNQISSAVKYRIVYLRLHAIHVYKVPHENRRKCQWHAIDAQLEVLRSKSAAYQTAFFKLVVQKDHDLFDGMATYEQLKAITDFAVPTTTEIEAYLDAHPMVTGEIEGTHE